MGGSQANQGHGTGLLNVSPCFLPLVHQGEDSCIMDGFYDQQVPFVVSEGVSSKHQNSITCHFRGPLEGWWRFGLRAAYVDCLSLQSCLTEEADRCVGERKTKFLDTELAQDTEGN